MSLIKEKILAFMREEAYKPMTAEELALIFDIDKQSGRNSIRY
ncbi:MAG: hypothetical protein KatS3mg079_718 [Caloramator sp.]|nr:MAG: hypothetical protein KatS3mg079_718 [Caloramator sp.]